MNFFSKMFHRNKDIIVCDIIIILICIIYSSLWFFNTFTITGWNTYYTELVLRGKVVYRDFYYYLPPLRLFIEVLLWKLSFNSLLIFRLWYLIERIFILLLLFRLLRRFFTTKISLFSVLIVSFAMTGSRYDLFGNYNQTTCLLELLMVGQTVKFVNNKKKKRLNSLFIAGICLGLMFLCKQTIFISSFICYFLCLCIYCLKKRDKKFFVYLLTVALGFMFSILPTLIYLLKNGAWGPFVDQVFRNVDGKGSIVSILFINPFNYLRYFIFPSLFFCLLLLFIEENSKLGDKLNSVIKKIKNIFIDLSKISKTILFVVFVITIFILLLFYIPDCIRYFTNAINEDSNVIWVIIIFLILSSLYFVVFRLFHKKSDMWRGIFGLLYIAIPCIIFSLSTPLSKACLILFSQDLFLEKLMIFVGCINICLVFIFFIYEFYDLFFLSCGSFALFYSFAMNAGTTPIYSLAILIALPIVVCFILNIRFRCSLYFDFFRILTLVICLFITSVCVSQKRAIGYQWWGYEGVAYEERNTPIEGVPSLLGAKGTPDEAQMYYEIPRLIKENTNQNDEVWGYPYIRQFNLLTDRFANNSFVPVLFYDVVGDKYVEIEKDNLSRNLPKVVLWKNIENCKETHEEVFRDGKPLKQREIELLFNKYIPQYYSIIGYYNDVEVWLNTRDQCDYSVGNVDEIIDVKQNNNVLYDRGDYYIAKYEFRANNPLSFKTNTCMLFQLDTKEQADLIKIYCNDVLISEISSIDNNIMDINEEIPLLSGNNNITISIEYDNKKVDLKDDTPTVIYLGAICD